MNYRKISMIFLCILCFSQLYAQITVRGRVTAATDQEALPGATVMVKGTNLGVTTNVQGEYQLEVPSLNETLVFSFIGLQTLEIAINGRAVIDVSLQDNIAQLGEVIVVGYGSVEKKLLTGSVSQINAKDITNTVQTGLDGALQGKVPGVQITQNSGTPGAALNVLVRGTSSISAGTQPLYVIDGIPITTGDYSQIGYEGQGINALSDINPNDIESITVLKDASAAAIYGARAANGVVLITTKSGTKDKSRITFDAYYGTQQVYKRLDLMDSRQFMGYVNAIAADENRAPVYTQEQIDNFPINTDWQDEVLRSAPIQSYQLSSSGGNDKTQYFISGAYFSQQGVVLGTDFDRLSSRININHKINDRFRIASKLNLSYSTNNRVPGDQSINGVLPNAISKPPILAVKDEDGNYLEQGFWDNPVANALEADNVAESYRNLYNIEWEYDILKGLTFKNQWGFDYYNLLERRYEPTTTRRGNQNGGIGISTNTRATKVVQQSTLNYTKFIHDVHNINVLLGQSFEIINDRFDFIRANNFPSNELRFVGAAGNIETATAGASEAGLVSYFSRISYDYKEKYLLTFNYRIDGSSRFGTNNQYAHLPGFSLGWRLSEEGFLDNVAWLQELKIRAGVGILGNDGIPNGRALSLYSAGLNYNGQPGTAPSQIPNPDLKWETTTSYNLGLDFGLWGARLNGTLDFYQNITNDLLFSRPLPGSSGFTIFTSNVGSLENKGVELGLNGQIIQQGDFNWNAGFNISANRNKVLSLYEGQSLTNQGRGNNAVIEGQPIGVFFMLQSMGVDPSTGELVMFDKNNDGIITDEDRMIVGDPTPKFTGGFTNNWSFKGFELSAFLQFVYGNDVFNGTRQYTENMSLGANDNQTTRVFRRWQQPGDITNVPKINGRFNNQITSHYLEDGSFLRLRNVTLAYNLPKSTLAKLKIQQARVYLTGQNLWTLTGYSGMDPEVNYAGNGALRAGTDFFTFPQTRSYIAGLSFTF